MLICKRLLCYIYAYMRFTGTKFQAYLRNSEKAPEKLIKP
ncbi:hypothetical protein BIFPSEUDO_02835 [Bifidobacterium pseudocatenulatum DSM 20438 = JCM 1200 = LMG 10505]|uniref:Uncharacterized protein n=1 Tax=Bifidobacterium pseudocatenulatum DSM 20438 = JCM 1200 = LMG 10505 TaxID=547043 RepID=C0BR29_BIFPS|nr:hypothetical protein BIFPSEUDO_02835 [Bifidobacterium pseudocatenulatum DSM 20438 = JCM 1200 = LMG 10505]